MSREHTPITTELAAYIREASLREPAAMRRQREQTADHPMAHYQISPEQGQFLYTLAMAAGARKALEIGVFMGYSAAWIASALSPGGKLIACERSEEHIEIARSLWRDAGVEHSIDLRLAPAHETLDLLLAEGHAATFDFIFIDADKPGYCGYFDRGVALARPRGLIVADNALMNGTVANYEDRDADVEGIRAFNRMVRDDSRVAMSLATVGDGMMVACKL
jgi:predicted O-methyltransferase YrrM